MVRIGELARRVGVSTDAVRFYERSGWLPRAPRSDNDYREYGEPDVEHLRLLIDLRRLDISLEDAARVASWCHSGHCGNTQAALPALIAARRAAVADRMAGLAALDARLAELERHLAPSSTRALTVLDVAPGPVGAAGDPSDGGGPCCDAAAAVEAGPGGCACCAAPA